MSRQTLLSFSAASSIPAPSLSQSSSSNVVSPSSRRTPLPPDARLIMVESDAESDDDRPNHTADADEDDVYPTNQPLVSLSSGHQTDDMWAHNEHLFSHPAKVFACSIAQNLETPLSSQNSQPAFDTLSEQIITFVESISNMIETNSDVFEAAKQITSNDHLELLPFNEIHSLFNSICEKLSWAIKALNNDGGIQRNLKGEIIKKALSLMTKIHLLENAFLNLLVYKRGIDVGDTDENVLLKWIEIGLGIQEPNPLQRLYIASIKIAISRGYSKYADGFYQRVVTSQGYITNAWEKNCTFIEFAASLGSVPDPDIKTCLTRTAGNFDALITLLAKQDEFWIPWLKPDRHAFAFNNGCYIANKNVFISFNKTGTPMMPDGKQCPTACKFHPQDVLPQWLTCNDYMDIPTPSMDLIMKTQKLSPAIMRCYYSMLGRAQYNLGEMDNWQVALYIKGHAGTGKSTLYGLVQSWYNPEDVGTLSNNVESTFGMSMVAKKFVIIGDDLGEKFSLDQQVFQNMVSGNPVSLPQKNKHALEKRWDVPILMSGNFYPGYKDNGGGAFSRRLFIINYKYPVVAQNPELPMHLRNEIAASIIKCNRAYQSMISRLSHNLKNGKTFWDAVPEEFKLEKMNVQQSCNPMMDFLNSGKVVYGHKETIYIPIPKFKKAFLEHCMENNLPRMVWQVSRYENELHQMSVSIGVKRERREYPRLPPNTPAGNPRPLLITDVFLKGCDLATTNALSLVTSESIAQADQAIIADALDEPLPKRTKK
jgi:hypothetical protein